MRESKDSLLDQFSRSSCDSCGEARYEGKVSADECPPTQPDNKKASRPTRPCDGPRMNPSVDVGNPPRPFRHLRMAERRSPDPSSSRVPVHSALVQKSVTAITNPAGRLSIWMLGKSSALSKWKTAKSWQAACNQSNHWFTNGLANPDGNSIPPACDPRKDLILLASCEFITQYIKIGPKASSLASRRPRRSSLSDVKNSHVCLCGGGCPPAGAWGGAGVPVRHRDCIPVGRLD